MLSNSCTPEEQQALELLAKKFSVDLNAPEIAGDQATFSSMEKAAGQVARGVAQQFLFTAMTKQEQLLEEPQPCPDCQTTCKVEVKQRTINTDEGPAEIPEAVCYCSACRRTFFPSAGAASTSSVRL